MAVYRKRQKDAQPVPALEVMASVRAGLGAAPGQGEGRARLQADLKALTEKLLATDPRGG